MAKSREVVSCADTPSALPAVDGATGVALDSRMRAEENR